MAFVALCLLLWSPLGTLPSEGTRSIPRHIHYTGFLANASDTTAVNDTLNFTFRLWSQETGGTLYWTETHADVPVLRGYFHVLLGSVTPLADSLFDGRTLFLEVQAGSETLSPRKQVASVAHAFHSLQADTARFALSSTGNFQGDVSISYGTLLFSHPSNPAIHVPRAQYTVLRIDTARGTPVRIDSVAGGNPGIDVRRADIGYEILRAYYGFFAYHTRVGSYFTQADTGLYVSTANNVGVAIQSAGQTGLFVGEAGTYGLHIGSVSTGIRVYDASWNGIEFHHTGHDAFSVESAGRHGLLVNSAGLNGVSVENAGGNGFYVGNADDHGLFVGETQRDGAYVGNAHQHGLEIGNADSSGVYIHKVNHGHGVAIDSVLDPAKHGLYVHSAGGDGVFVENAGAYGLYIGSVSTGIRVYDASWNGIEFHHTGHDAFSVESADRYGLLVDSAGSDGVFVENAGGNGFYVGNADDHGLFVGETQRDGAYVGNAHQHGLEIGNADSSGVYIHKVNHGHGVAIDSVLDPAKHGLYVHSAGGDGVFVENAGTIGLHVGTTGGSGVHVHHANGNGYEVDYAGDDGVFVENVSGSGVDIRSADSSGIYIQKVNYGHGIEIDSVKRYSRDGVHVHYAGDDGFQVDNAGYDGIVVMNAGWYGVNILNAGSRGIYIGRVINGHGIEIDSVGGDYSHGVRVHYAGNDGFQVESAGGDGVFVWDAGRDGVKVWNASNTGVYAYGKHKGGWFENDTSGFSYPTLDLHNLHGSTANEYIARFSADYFTEFYFRGDGNAYANGGWNTFKRNSKGEYESFSAIEAERQEIVAHGRAKLVNGEIHIEFPESFSEFVSDQEPINITVTPKSSAVLYIPNQNTRGFTVKCDIGDENAEFDWLAIGVQKDKEVRPILPNIAYEDSVMMAMMEKKRQEERARHEAEKREREAQPRAVKAHTDEKPTRALNRLRNLGEN